MFWALHVRRLADGLPVGRLLGRAVERLRHRVVDAEEGAAVVGHVAALVHAEVIAINVDGRKVRELLHCVGLGGLLGDGLIGHGRGHGLNHRCGHGLNHGCGILLRRNGRRTLGRNGRLLLIALGRGLLALLLGRAGLRGAVRGVRGGRRRRGRLLGARLVHGALPRLKGLKDLRVRPGLVGLLSLEHGAELLDHGCGALEVLGVSGGGGGRLEERANALRELDPHIGLLLGRIGVLHLLLLLRRRAHGNLTAGRDGDREVVELRLERLDGLQEHGGVDDGHLKLEGLLLLDICILEVWCREYGANRFQFFFLAPVLGLGRAAPEMAEQRKNNVGRAGQRRSDCRRRAQSALQAAEEAEAL